MDWVRILDPGTGDELDGLDLDDTCGGGPELCGGCSTCILMQASHHGGVLVLPEYESHSIVRRLRALMPRRYGP